MNVMEKPKPNEKPPNDFNLGKVVNKFNMNNYNEDFVITNNILKYHMKSVEIYNYEKNKIYDKDELDLYKEKLINKDNVHYYPYELYFNTYRNIYKEEKVLLNLPNNLSKAKEKEHEERDDREEQDEKEEKEVDREDNASIPFEEEHGLEDDYNFDYNKSEDELDNDDNDENVI
ncbi:conserved Plasmodium protein, unknown function [Plasmodium ovale wallikeri]|uniref:Uncharacterized protein n=2 Tax=Plasmodium ovale TaxID=36330 RepID=A0A1A8ZCZ7_PLAOA|nr:conserved Plasmodium protein, unknown function [Plasmodium ovale wallikeri]SBT42155.1 conserved Plasmodium protein, unknown function [Plasmodium ovale wallikeri]SBT78241.1 conserved Plasmodium protein, unknown function [Plasmodium ovale]